MAEVDRRHSVGDAHAPNRSAGEHIPCRNPCLISVRVGPATSRFTASAGVAPGRDTCTSCSPCKKQTATRACGAADGADAAPSAAASMSSAAISPAAAVANDLLERDVPPCTVSSLAGLGSARVPGRWSLTMPLSGRRYQRPIGLDLLRSYPPEPDEWHIRRRSLPRSREEASECVGGCPPAPARTPARSPPDPP